MSCPQKRIDALLKPDRRRQRGPAPRPDGRGPFDIVHYGRVARLEGRGEPQVGQRVLVTAEHQRVVSQLRKRIERREHLRSRPFEQPPTAGAEESVPAKEAAVPHEGDVARGVPGNVENLELQVERGQRNAVSRGQALHLDGQALACRTECEGARLRDELGGAADVIRMMMRRENGREAQALPLERGEDRRRIARVDDGDRARVARAADHPDVVVLERCDRRHVGHVRVCGKARQAANWPARRGRGYAFGMASQPAELSSWLAGPLGGMVLEEERTVVAGALECAFGLHCVQVGAWGAPDEFLRLARTRRAALVAECATEGAALVSPADSLALQSDSVDVMLLPHTLEFAPDPHEVLREAGRVLAGEGELVVLAFEPLGCWWLRHSLGRACPPGLSRAVSAPRLTEWLKLVGFEVGSPERYLYVPPLASLAARKARGALERIGRRTWPRFSGAYLLHARKRVHSMTPVRLRKRLRTAVIGGLTEPAARRVS
jgi:SAM-dependent methyltransferase